MKNLDKVKYFDPKKLMELAWKHVSKFSDRVTKQGKDYQGRQFEKYSEKYTEKLRTDYRRKDGRRYAGMEGFSPTTSGEKISKRQFLLRGLTMVNLRPRGSSNDSYTIGWEGEAAAIVEGNAYRRKGAKRNIIDGIPKDEMEWVVKELGNLVEGEWKKIPNVTRIKA